MNILKYVMNRLIMLWVLLSVLLAYGAERTTLEIGKDYVLEDKKISLVDVSSKQDAAIFCVNGQKGIVSESSINKINDVFIELSRIREDTVYIELTYECHGDCICDEKCDNTACFVRNEEPLTEDNTDDAIVITSGNGDEIFVEPTSINVNGIIIALLIVIVLFLGIFVLWKRS